MKFIILVSGIILFCAAAAYWSLYGGVLPLCWVLAGLAIIAGEGYKIAMNKELEAAAIDAAEEKLEKDMKADGLTPPRDL